VPVERLRASVLLLAGLCVVALVLIQGIAYWERRDAALEEAARRAENLAHILKEHIDQTVAAADAALRQIVVQNARLGGPAGAAGEWKALLDASYAGVAGVGSLSVIDAAGTIRHSTIAMIVGQSRADHFLFRALRDDPGAGIVADPPFRSLTSGQMLMPIGRRLQDSAGAFQGAVVATLELALLRELYRSVDAGPGGVVRVLHSSGVVFFREPSQANPAGEPAADDPVFRAFRRGVTAGVIDAPLQPRGEGYLSAFRATGAPQLIVAVSLKRADVLADWWRDLGVSAGVTAALALALVLAALQIRHQLAARAAAERAVERREREMAMVQSVAGLGSLAIDVAAGAVRLTPQFNRIVGWPEAREAAALDEFLALAQAEDRARIQAALADCAREGGSYRLEFALKRADGGGRRFWSEGFRHDHGPGGRPEIVAFCQDVTDRRSLEERQLQSQKMEALGQLTGGIAHDFNNLLTVLMGGADLLAERLKADPALRHQAEGMVAAAQKGADLTRRLLAFARRQPLAPQPFDANRLIAGMDSLLRRSLGEQVEIEIVRGAGLWSALADPSQLETAILNLAINARDAMPSGGRLTIETANAHIDQAYAALHPDVAPGQYVMIAVADTGTGMAPEVAARAFEPFFTTKPVDKGTGLGLSMVYGFVKQSGGHVKIYSEPGTGTTVKLYLPRAAGDGAAAVPAAKTETPRGSERVLVVEDDADVRAYAERQLTELGYAVTAVGSGPAALALLRREPAFDLLFTDIVMPGGMNGRELAQAVTREWPRLKVLYTSGYAENSVIHHGHLEPGVVLLPKPYRRAELAAKVRAVLDGAGRPA
jgi:signal transduction histidine kinase